jgi:hypothetical protein
VASLVSAVGPAADGDEVSGDAGAATADPVVAGSGTSVAVMACVGGAGRVTERVVFAGWAVSAAVSGRVGPGRVAVRLGRLGNAAAERDNVPDGRLGASPLHTR